MNAGSPAPRCWVVIPAAGRGERMSAAHPKQYLPLAGATVLEHALNPFLDHPRIAGIVVALAADDPHWDRLSCAKHPSIHRALGGAQRMHSVLNGLNALSERADPHDWVLVHDAARPCLPRADLDRLLDTLQTEAVGGLLALRMNDTVKRADSSGRRISSTVERHDLWCAQTPQMFRLGQLRQALQDAVNRGASVTDEAAAIEALDLAPRLVEGSPFNIKVTRPEDLILAAAILASQRRG